MPFVSLSDLTVEPRMIGVEGQSAARARAAIGVHEARRDRMRSSRARCAVFRRERRRLQRRPADRPARRLEHLLPCIKQPRAAERPAAALLWR